MQEGNLGPGPVFTADNYTETSVAPRPGVVSDITKHFREAPFVKQRDVAGWIIFGQRDTQPLCPRPR